ncbi:amidase domain-containing protein [Gottfriedia sp. NPDC057991]|uniref:amidase domain-containing protein n=1 Tax=Gottfriedia sp. NPDC057991 TaxID=3346298 RepID=UPI0036D91A22
MSTQEDGEFSELEANPDYNFIRTYASTYLIELDNSGNTGGNFQLDPSITSKTINEIRNENQVMNYESETKEPASSLVTPTITYSRSAAISYADYWAKGSNPAYRDFGDTDCTNFASQVVKAGGYPIESRTYSGVDPSAEYWYYKDSTHYSNSWSTVVGFYNYWVGSQGHSTQKYSYASGVMGYSLAGDIVQLYDKGGRGWYHTIVIAYNSNGTVTYDVHSIDRLRYSLFTISDENNDYRVIKF